jgi:DNA polymerase-3 subunit gamma/tau
MASQALYRKWRSQTFNEIIGQEHVTQTLINSLHMDRVAHAYLFSGPRGTGKTSTARLLAKAVNCLASDVAQRPCNSCAICTSVTEGRLMDLIEIDAASNTGVDDIRDLREKVGFRPSQARVKFYIIDEVHMLSNSAFNALLKTLEEPPEHVIFVLATTEPERIPATITSRCQRFDFKRIRLYDVAAWLGRITETEGFKAEPEALELIARQGGGSMRDAISLLDQMISYGGEAVTVELVQNVLGTVASESVIGLVTALIKRDVATGLDIINQVVGDGIDPRQFAREIVTYLRWVMLVKFGRDSTTLNLPEEILVEIGQQAKTIDAGLIVHATRRFNEAQVDIKSGLLTIPQLPLELAFVDSAEYVPVAVTAPLPGGQAAAMTVRPSSAAPRQPSPSRPAAPRPPEPSPEAPVIRESPTAGEMVTPSPGTGMPITVETVMSVFERILDDLETGRTKDGRRGTMISKALRHNARLVRTNDNEIVFATSSMLKGRFEQAQPLANIEDVFSRSLGRPVVVRFVIEQQQSSGENRDETRPADIDSQTETLLKTAESLGGEISRDSG